MDTYGNSNGSGLSFASGLALLFIGLKLGHVISWPWLWVLSPLWISFIILALLLTVAVLIK